MTRQELIRLAEQKIIRLDGATGTELIKRGLPPGVCPESWCIQNPGAITSRPAVGLLNVSDRSGILNTP